jgi:hypothetical protein
MNKEELRRFCFLLDNNIIHTMPRYIRAVANSWATQAQPPLGQLLCELPDSSHPIIAKLLTYFDHARTNFHKGSYQTSDERFVLANPLLSG